MYCWKMEYVLHVPMVCKEMGAGAETWDIELFKFLIKQGLVLNWLIDI